MVFVINRRMRVCQLLLGFFIFSLTIFRCSTYRCDRVPTDLSDNPKSNNGKYVLEIEGKPETYIPNYRYPIAIKVDTYVYSTYKFKKFILTLESKRSVDDAEGLTYQTGKFEMGGDALSRFSDTCKDTVVEANTQPKRQVSVIWNAPPSESGCVTIRATVIESREKWYADEGSGSGGYLTKTLCEDLNENEDEMPEVLDECCACDEAKYEMAFQGNWIRNTHPKGFPEDVWTTRFGDIIGASHNNDYHFWMDGDIASSGLKELAFNGSTKTLESELMGNITDLHTIIKARGLAYPNITSSSYAIFRVDKGSHLVSLVSKMIPSPDWIVGVSRMELCVFNCSWKQSRTINLYPRDVGIDDGLQYTESKPAAEEQPITEITSLEPVDSPFYDISGEKIKPVAKLHFKLIKIYKKECESTEPENNLNET